MEKTTTRTDDPLKDILRELAGDDDDLILNVQGHQYGIEADVFYRGAPRKGVELQTEQIEEGDDAGKTLVDVTARGSTLYQETVRVTYKTAEEIKRKMADALGVRVGSPVVEVEFTCDLEDAYQRLDGSGEMTDHDYLLMGSEKTPREAAEAAVTLATETRSVVLLAYDGFAVQVFTGHPTDKITDLISREL